MSPNNQAFPSLALGLKGCGSKAWAQMGLGTHEAPRTSPSHWENGSDNSTYLAGLLES